jgi:hypothetical protein
MAWTGLAVTVSLTGGRATIESPMGKLGSGPVAFSPQAQRSRSVTTLKARNLGAAWILTGFIGAKGLGASTPESMQLDPIGAILARCESQHIIPANLRDCKRRGQGYLDEYAVRPIDVPAALDLIRSGGALNLEVASDSATRR